MRAPFAPLALLVAASACTSSDPSGQTPSETKPVCDPAAPPAPKILPERREPCADRDPHRKPLFGDLHVHTRLSFDAWVEDVRTGPADAYAYARGGALTIPKNGDGARGTQTVKLKRPLDFAAVTDHAEFLGEVLTCTVEGSPGYDSATCVEYRKGGFDATQLFGVALAFPSPTRRVDVCGDDGERCVARARDGWAEIRDAAEAAYDRTSACRFTSLVGYEWSGATGASNLHRNVVFRDEHVPAAPVSYLDEPTPEGLWRRLGCACAGEVDGCEVLAIPHNSNLANGKMFSPSYEAPATIEEERARARTRARLEPLVEVFQHKGTSECLNGPWTDPAGRDPLCDEEQVRADATEDCGEKVGGLGILGKGCVSRYDFVRHALVTGLDEEVRLGVNPYRLGMIGSTDTHVGTPGATDEESFTGHLGSETTLASRLGKGDITSAISGNPGGLVGVWSVENSRHAIFDALARREAFGTSGPRIVPRVFASWGFSKDLCAAPDYAAIGDAEGVPMGGVLGAPPKSGASPTFFVLAERDPDPGEQDLERVQIIKGWRTPSGALRTQIFEVAAAPGPFEVDEATCTSKSKGAPTLCGTWTDPSFDPADRAFYYVRVVATPSCRWSARQCLTLAEKDRPEGCTATSMKKIVHEMAWTSPVWVSP